MIATEKRADAAASSPTILPVETAPSAIDEINHRIANNLQLLSAMVSVEARRIADPIALKALDMTMRRIAAIASIHRHLYRSGASTSVDLGSYLEDLGEHLEHGCADAHAGRHVFVDADRLHVSAQDATAIGVIVSELVGNACKYAYPEDQPGDIHIALKRTAAKGLVLQVSDSGRGIDPTASAKGTGLGGRMVAMMAERLGASFEWQDAAPGVRFMMRIDKL